jgi:AraC family transcriptional regulator
MTPLIQSLKAQQHLRGSMTACSWKAGWRSLLLREYEGPCNAEEFTTLPTPDHLIVLVTGGSCTVEARHQASWHKAHYRVGSIGMNAPGKAATLRWRGESKHHTLQLHLPSTTVAGAFEELTGRDARFLSMPNDLLSYDALIEITMPALAEAMAEGVPDVYAESAADFLATHLLVRHARLPAPRAVSYEDKRLNRVAVYLRENLGAQLSLEQIAKEAGLSRFHLVRLFKRAHGETPFKRLTRLRMEEAERRLRNSRDSVSEIAFACGYENPAHFASAFRRTVGVSPSQYRRKLR